jgi:hypothetical protein
MNPWTPAAHVATVPDRGNFFYASSKSLLTVEVVDFL